MRHRSLLYSGLVLVPMVVLGQTPPAANSVQQNEILSMNADHVAAEVAARSKAMEHDLMRYVYTEDYESLGYNSRGKITSRFRSRAEEIFLNGISYMRTATDEGGTVGNLKMPAHEIKGEALERMNQETVERTHEFSLLHVLIAEPSPRLALGKLILASYENKIAGRETIDGYDCVILDSQPRSNTTDPEAIYRIRVWVNIQNFDVLQYSTECLKGYLNVVPGSVIKTEYRYFSGTLLPARMQSDASFSTQPGHQIRLQNTRVYSDYHRLSVTTNVSGVDALSTDPSSSPSITAPSAPSSSPKQ